MGLEVGEGDRGEGGEGVGENSPVCKHRSSTPLRYIVSQNHNVISGQNTGVVAFFSP